MHADLYLRPAVQNFGLLQYAALSEIQRLGYIHATEAHRPDQLGRAGGVSSPTLPPTILGAGAVEAGAARARRPEVRHL